MSSILKALKKLEEEKSLHSETKKLNVSREILRQPDGEKKMLKRLWLLGGSAALVIVILTVALLRKPAPQETRKQPEAPAALPAGAVPAQENLPVAPRLNGSGKKTLPAEAGEAEPERKTARQLQEQPATRPPAAKSTELPGAAPRAAEHKELAPPPKAAADQAAPGDGTALTLSGIAWNKDSADRLAIINGQPAAIGATVGGAIVEEILPDRVKLSRNGRSLELFIGKSTKTE